MYQPHSGLGALLQLVVMPVDDESTNLELLSMPYGLVGMSNPP